MGLSHEGGSKLKATRIATILFAISIPLPFYVELVGRTTVQILAILVLVTFGAEWAFRSTFGITLRKQRGVNLTLLVIGIALLAVASIVSAVSALDSRASLEVAIRYGLGLALIAVIVHSHQSYRELNALSNALVGGACVAGMIAVLGHAVPAVGEHTAGVGGRAQVFFEHPNQLGMVLSATFAIALSKLFRNARDIRYWTAAALIGVGVVASGSVANVLLLAVAILGISIFALRRAPLSRRPGLVLLGTLIVGVTLPVALKAISQVSPRIQKVVEVIASGEADIEEALPSVTARAELYQLAWQRFLDRPIVGVGGDNAYLYLRNSSGRPVRHAHNFVMEVLLTLGVVGFVAATIFILGWLTIASRLLGQTSDPNAHLRVGIGFALLIFLISNQSSDSLGGTIVYLAWLLLSLGFVLSESGHSGIQWRGARA